MRFYTVWVRACGLNSRSLRTSHSATEGTLARTSRRTTTNTSNGESKIVRTFGEIFADDSVIELVAAAPGNRLDLLFWNGHQKTIAHQVEHRGRLYRAHDIDESLLRAIHFPRDASDYGTARQLFSQIRNLFERYAGLPSPESALMTAWSCSILVSGLPIEPANPGDFHSRHGSRRLLFSGCSDVSAVVHCLLRTLRERILYPSWHCGPRSLSTSPAGLLKLCDFGGPRTTAASMLSASEGEFAMS